MQFRIVRGLAILTTALVLSACESTSGVKEDTGAAAGPVTTTEQQGSGADASGAVTSGAGTGTSGGFQGNALDDPSSLLATRIVYFAYDSSELTDADRPVVEAHGRYLADNPGAAVTLEGHADERGSREYNIALGERRAIAVRQLMTLLGASGSQIRVVSYGEERPAAEGHDESAWSVNRRVEIVYLSR
jgi:peptidoglycan-associated lipoprotein